MHKNQACTRIFYPRLLKRITTPLNGWIHILQRKVRRLLSAGIRMMDCQTQTRSLLSPTTPTMAMTLITAINLRSRFLTVPLQHHAMSLPQQLSRPRRLPVCPKLFHLRYLRLSLQFLLCQKPCLWIHRSNGHLPVICSQQMILNLDVWHYRRLQP